MKRFVRGVAKNFTAAFVAFVVLMFAVTLLVLSYGTPAASANCMPCSTCGEGGHHCQFGSTSYCISCGSSAGCYAMECNGVTCYEVYVDPEIITTTCESCGVQCNL